MVRRVAARVFAAGAITSATVATVGTTTPAGGSSVASSNTRSRGVAHVASSAPVTAATAAKKHWSADGEGINAEQRALAKVQSTDPIERLSAATTRELLQSACSAPGVIDAELQAEVVASSVSASSSGTADEEAAFLAKMEQEFGRDVLQVLRRQQWAVNIAATGSAKDQVATLVCYFQEGTQRILYRRLTSA